MQLPTPVLGVALVVALAASACSASTGDSSAPPSPSPGEATGQTENTGNPGTLLPPTMTTEAPQFLLPVSPLVAFLDACVVNAGLAGPCHCAGSRLQDSFSENDLIIFEDRLTGRNEFSPEVAAALVDCRDAPAPPAWSNNTVQLYVLGCTEGSSRLEELCRCSVSRAYDVIPEARVRDYLEANDTQPSLVDLINTCI